MVQLPFFKLRNISNYHQKDKRMHVILHRHMYIYLYMQQIIHLENIQKEKTANSVACFPSEINNEKFTCQVYMDLGQSLKASSTKAIFDI